MERITGRTNPLLQRVKRLRDDRKTRRQEGVFLGDGIKLLEEALRWGAQLETVILADGVAAPELPDQVRCVTVPADVMRSISPMEAPQGALFIARANDLTPPDTLNKGRYLILDGLQDPGNVGTILRTADAFGCDGLLLTNHCADPYSPKVVRATMGAIFRTSVWEVSAQALPALMARSGLSLAATALRDDALSLPCAQLKDAAIVIGSEGKGVSAALLEQCDTVVQIPMREKCESLNAAVAAAVVLWELYRRDELC